MPSSSSQDHRPTGRHQAPRRGGRSLTNRRIIVTGDRRDEIDLHYLGKALLGLAHDQYDAAHDSSGTGPLPADVPRSRAESPSGGATRGQDRSRPDTGTDGREG